jgi:predicted DCC family thiol-disulfide oxidoreductase YuxK
MHTIYVLYDSRCGVCSRLRAWMVEQPAYVALEFVAAGSARARRLFPELHHDEQPSELVVVTDDGDVYINDAAWIVCLYALVDYRAWSFRLARLPLRRLARSAWEMLSKNRAQLSRVLALTSDAELARRLEAQPLDSACAVEWDGS